MVVNVKDFLNGLKYLKTFSPSQGRNYTVAWYGGKISIKGTEGDIESEVDVKGEMSFKVHFNGLHMAEALSHFTGKIKIYLDGNREPFVLTSGDAANFAVVIPLTP